MLAYKGGCTTAMHHQQNLEGDREGEKEMMKSSGSVLLQILVVKLLVVACVSQSNYDFFYFVQEWPASYCDNDGGCCYPPGGNPPLNFTIHGLWPNYNNGSYPSDCNPDYPFNETQILDLVRALDVNWPSGECGSTNEDFWAHEWDKHGTCSILDEHEYFAASLNLKYEINLLATLEAAGIYPNGSYYSVDSITAAILGGTGLTPGLGCNTDAYGNNQLYEIYLCVDVTGRNYIECSILPNNTCTATVEFPPMLFT